jgi:hypothetical protein
MMRLDKLSAIVGLTTAATAALVIAAPEASFASVFFLESGTTSVTLETETLESVGLSLTGTNNTVPAADGFLVGFNITPDTDFSFDPDGGFAPVGGTIEHEGSVTFNDDLTVGDFSIGFDAARATDNTSGFFVQDTLDTGAILFDVATPDEVTFDEEGQTLALEGDLLVSPEFAGVLQQEGLIGGVVGAARTEASTSAVPEPTTILGALTAGTFLTAVRRRLAKRK